MAAAPGPPPPPPPSTLLPPPPVAAAVAEACADYSALAPDEAESESDLGGVLSQGDDAGAGSEGFEVDGRALVLRSVHWRQR